jgi:GntR family transcriptional repressor for pyruvate dehydrogenase complex
MSAAARPDIDWSQLPVSGRSVADDLVARLQAMIFDGRLEPGTRLPSERELQAALGVSRVSVREALHQLELQGLVDRRPGRGTMVVGPDRSDRATTLLARLTVADRDLLELMDLRAAIEPPIAARAAGRATAADLRDLRRLVEEMGTASAVARVIELDEAFHAAIARATHNPLFTRLLDVMADWLGATRRAGLQSRRRRQESIAAHTRILDAIAARDATAAAAGMRDHIESVNRLLAEQEVTTAERGVPGRP